jgi:hypothetical protein
MKSTLAEGCRSSPPGYIGWQADTTTRVDYISPTGSKNLASGFRVQEGLVTQADKFNESGPGKGIWRE